MKTPWSKLTLFAVAAGAAFMAMGSDEDHVPAKKGRAGMQQVAMTQSDAAAMSKPAAAKEMLEFESMLQKKQHRDPGGDRKIGNVFNATSWYVPPPPPPPLPPPPPAAPPLPFSFVGHYRDAESKALIIFLTDADRVYTVSEGDVIDGTYSVGPIVSGQIEFTYLPLKIKQSLNTGGAL